MKTRCEPRADDNLRQCTIRDTHKQKMNQLLTVNITNEVTIGELVNGGLLRNKDAPNEIAKVADAECVLERELRRLESAWQRICFGFVNCPLSIMPEDTEGRSPRSRRPPRSQSGRGEPEDRGRHGDEGRYGNDEGDELGEEDEDFGFGPGVDDGGTERKEGGGMRREDGYGSGQGKSASQVDTLDDHIDMLAQPEPLLQLIEDSQIQLKAIAVSPYRAIVQIQINHWTDKLNYFEDVVRKLAILQALWVDLYPAFSSIEPILSSLQALTSSLASQTYSASSQSTLLHSSSNQSPVSPGTKAFSRRALSSGAQSDEQEQAAALASVAASSTALQHENAKIVVDLQSCRIQFRGVEGHWREFLETLVRNTTVRLVYPATAIMNTWREQDSRIPSSLPDLLSLYIARLQKCQASFSQFLQSRRTSFPRFYFLSDHMMTDIVSLGGNIQLIQAHMKNVFGGIRSFCLSRKGSSSYCEQERSSSSHPFCAHVHFSGLSCCC